jgi:hypothetical protein
MSMIEYLSGLRFDRIALTGNLTLYVRFSYYTEDRISLIESTRTTTQCYSRSAARSNVIRS